MCMEGTLGVSGHILRDDGGAMYGMPVHDEIDATTDRLQQPCQELHEDRSDLPGEMWSRMNVRLDCIGRPGIAVPILG